MERERDKTRMKGETKRKTKRMTERQIEKMSKAERCEREEWDRESNRERRKKNSRKDRYRPVRRNWDGVLPLRKSTFSLFNFFCWEKQGFTSLCK